MIYKKLELDWTFVFRVRDRFPQNYKMRTWSGFRMTRHIYFFSGLKAYKARDNRSMFITEVQHVTECTRELED